MESEKEEYLCSVTFSTVFDPVNITPTTFLYDRNTVETWVEKNPRTATIPQTRQPFLPAHITPNVALRAEMRQYFQGVMGNEYTGWEVIPDYPHQLPLHQIRDLLAYIRQLFPNADAEEDLDRMTEEIWSNAWKRLTYLRLNLQMNAINRQLFLSDEQSINCLAELIVVSYTRGVKTDESDLFHREILRTILAVDLITHEARYRLKPQNESHCGRFIGFLLRGLQWGDEGLQTLVLRLLLLTAESLKPEEFQCIPTYISEANALAFSSTDLRILAQIVERFLRSNFTEVNSPFIIQMQKRVLEALVQILTLTLGVFKSEDRLGIVEDACEALHIALFHLNRLLEGPLEFQEARLAFSIDINLLRYIHEMIEMTVQQRSPHWIHLDANHCLNALGVATIFYQNVGNADLMREKEYNLYRSFLNGPIAMNYNPVRNSDESILELFREFVGIEQYPVWMDEEN